MDWQGWLTIFITAGVFITLVSSSRLGPDIVLMGALLLLSISGVLDAQEALSGFSNSGLITVAAMFVVAAGIRASGGVDLVVNRLLGRPNSERAAMVRLATPVIALSGFLNNTPVVATMIPAVTRWAKQLNLPASSLMIPLSYVAEMEIKQGPPVIKSHGARPSR